MSEGFINILVSSDEDSSTPEEAKQMLGEAQEKYGEIVNWIEQNMEEDHSMSFDQTKSTFKKMCLEVANEMTKAKIAKILENF